MHIRFVRLNLKEEKVWDARKFYEERVLPNLEEIDGCRFAGLLQGTIHGDDYISMTVWTSAEAAKSYEHGGLFDRLLDESDELMQEADVQPGAGDLVVFTGVEPDVEIWDVVGKTDDEILEKVSQERIFVRMVAVRLRRGGFEEFASRFEGEVRPALSETPGCLGAFLIAGAGDRPRVLSVTLWSREEDAVRYGLSGEFDRLTLRLKDTFSDLYQWKLAQSDEPDSVAASQGGEPDVEGYQMVIGRKFK